jgi:type I restriction enzyme M protein
MTLKIVRDQWNRVVFMQTNREDVGKRYLEIEVPFPPSRERADEISEPFRSYFTTLATEREKLRNYLDTSSAHHFFISGANQVTEVEEA